MRQETLRLENVSKEIFHTKILNHLDLSLFAGETAALLGANGAGKTVLMELLAGIVSKDEGQIYYQEYPVEIRTPQDAKRLKIQYIPSQGGYIDALTVYDNLYFDNDGRFLVRYREQKKEARRLLYSMGLSLKLSHRYRKLSIGQKKLVKLAAAIRTGPRILIMDEPMAFLSQEERKVLLGVLEEQKAKGTSILIATQNIQMARRFADWGIVLRDGSHVGTFPMDRYDDPTMLSMMTGRLYQKERSRDASMEESVRLKVKDLCGEGILHADFEVRKGEILGIVGLSGSGRTRIMDLLFGLKPKTGGSIYLDGKLVQIHSPEDALKCRIAYASNKEGQFGVVDTISVQENIVLPSLKKVSTCGCVSGRMSRFMADYYLGLLFQGAEASVLDLATMEEPSFFPELDRNRPVHELSLGFYQMVKIAQCLSVAPKVLLLDRPTLGLDLEMKGRIHNLLKTLSRQGMCILMVSDEMEEITSLCSRVLILNQGVLTGEMDREEMEDGSGLPDMI
ncbi:MAG: ATP-binding cassette domain-containing protein [Blautia sp.]